MSLKENLTVSIVISLFERFFFFFNVAFEIDISPLWVLRTYLVAAAVVAAVGQ